MLDRLGRRYRGALLSQTLVWALLATAVAAVGWMKLQTAGISGRWSWAAPAVAAALGLTWLGASVRHRWLSGGGLAARLDGVLALKQRLVTAAELAKRSERPALYPLLVEDASRLFDSGAVRVPPAAPRAARVLALVLVLLWLLPWPRRAGAGPQIAQPPRAPTPQETPAPPEPQPDQQQQQPKGAGASQSQAPQQGAGAASPQSSKASGRDAPQQARGEQTQTGGDADGTQQPQTQDGAQARADSQAQQEPRQADGSQSAAKPQERTRSEQAQASQRTQGQHAQASGARERRPGGTGEQGTQQGADAAQNLQQGATGGQGEALKADIQQLLRELSQELEQLQEQMSQAPVRDAPPAPGTSSDPELYGPSESLSASGQTPVPIQLETDPAQTQTRRPGGGVGRPSGEVSRDSPQRQAEEAALSAQPSEEQPTTRQAVPAEYRTVFERLRQPATPPSPTTKESP